MKLAAFFMSCPERAESLAATLQSLSKTDWRSGVEVVMDDQRDRKSDRMRNIVSTWRRLIERALCCDADFYLLMEDDLEFNVYLEHNMRSWGPLRARRSTMPCFASLYNPARPCLWRNESEHYVVAAPYEFWGSQAVVVSRASAEYFLRNWEDIDGPADLKMPRLSARLGPVFCYLPSLVQHTGMVSTWGGMQHMAGDYDVSFRAEPQAMPEGVHTDRVQIGL